MNIKPRKRKEHALKALKWRALSNIFPMTVCFIQNKRTRKEIAASGAWSGVGTRGGGGGRRTWARIVEWLELSDGSMALPLHCSSSHRMWSMDQYEMLFLSKSHLPWQSAKGPLPHPHPHLTAGTSCAFRRTSAHTSQTQEVLRCASLTTKTSGQNDW